MLGATAATFLLLELFGTRLMLWLACLVNLLVAMGARTAATAVPVPRTTTSPRTARPAPDAARSASRSRRRRSWASPSC